MKATSFTEKKSMHTRPTNNVLLIEPKSFGFNTETATDNTFQIQSDLDLDVIQKKASEEFHNLVSLLQANGVNVVHISDLPNQATPDSVFPNNWISTHKTGEIIIYPMFAPSRRNEIRLDIVAQLKNQFNYNKVIDFTHNTSNDRFLEGTGSLVLDRSNYKAYCCLSERSHLSVLKEWTMKMEYEMVYFNAFNEDAIPIYHTNVMMTLADQYAVVCLDSIHDIEERIMLIENLEETEKEIIEISYDQLHQFAGNMIELANQDGESVIVMSQAAHDSLTLHQLERINSYSSIISAPIPLIEKNGGGSVRCMIAELFLPI